MGEAVGGHAGIKMGRRNLARTLVRSLERLSFARDSLSIHGGNDGFSSAFPQAAIWAQLYQDWAKRCGLPTQ